MAAWTFNISQFGNLRIYNNETLLVWLHLRDKRSRRMTTIRRLGIAPRIRYLTFLIANLLTFLYAHAEQQRSSG